MQKINNIQCFISWKDWRNTFHYDFTIVVHFATIHFFSNDLLCDRKILYGSVYERKHGWDYKWKYEWECGCDSQPQTCNFSFMNFFVIENLFAMILMDFNFYTCHHDLTLNSELYCIVNDFARSPLTKGMVIVNII